MLAMFPGLQDRNSPKPSARRSDPVARVSIRRANWAPLSTAGMRPSGRTWRLVSHPQETEERLFRIRNVDPSDGKDGSRPAFLRTQVLRSRDTLPGSTPLARRYSCLQFSVPQKRGRFTTLTLLPSNHDIPGLAGL